MGRYGLIHPKSGNRYVFSTVVMDTIDGPMSSEWYSVNWKSQLGDAMTLEEAQEAGEAWPMGWGACPNVFTFDLIKRAEP